MVSLVRTKTGRKPDPTGRPLELTRIGYGPTWLPGRSDHTRGCKHGVSIVYCCPACEDELELLAEEPT